MRSDVYVDGTVSPDHWNLGDQTQGFPSVGNGIKCMSAVWQIIKGKSDVCDLLG
jgi:hypothetical protein